MRYVQNFGGLGESVVRDFRIGATVVQGQLVIRDTSLLGNVTDPSTTAGADAIGSTFEAGTYTASTPVDVMVQCAPFAVYKARANGATTNPTALTVFTQTSASQTVLTAASQGSAVMDGGYAICVSGNNKGRKAVLTSHVDNTSRTCTNGFPASVAVGDKFIIVPFAEGAAGVTLTSDFVEVDGSVDIVHGAGVAACVTDVKYDVSDESVPTVDVYFILRDHAFNAVD